MYSYAWDPDEITVVPADGWTYTDPDAAVAAWRGGCAFINASVLAPGEGERVSRYSHTAGVLIRWAAPTPGVIRAQ